MTKKQKELEAEGGAHITGSEIRELRKYLWGRGKEAYMAKRQRRKEK